MSTVLKDPAHGRRLVHGVGINDSTEPTGNNCPYYKRWAAMIRRCHSEKELSKHPSYRSCSIAPEWLSFSAFKAWMKEQDWQGKHLDKDLLVPGNRVYGPQFCVFVSPEVNRFTTEKKSYAGNLPIGVSVVPENGRYRSQCCNLKGLRVGLGCFDTPEQAHLAWRRKKHELACLLAANQEDPRVSSALKSRYAA